MRKRFLSAVLIFITFGVFAQNDDYQHVISVQSGVSLFSPFRGKITSSQEASDTTVSFSSGKAYNFPQINVAYDHGINRWFSIGGAVSYNKVSLDLKDVVYNKKENLGDVKLNVSRVTIGARALFHYGNANRLDMYSGVRLGIGIWGVNASSSSVDNKLDEVFKEAGGSGIWRTVIGNKLGGGFVLPQVQVILFGLRGYITENIGINGELSAGSPYFASIGLNYRFGSGY
ncbi:hypothetical protein [Runella sp.]|uniref:hypothetical protein n=1 Tax=Runella sp. TaxID=1960881 RepID=UPI003D0A795F